MQAFVGLLQPRLLLVYSTVEIEGWQDQLPPKSPVVVCLTADPEPSSDHDFEQLVFPFTDWEVGLRFYGDMYNDRSADLQDGQLFASTLLLKRYF